MNNTDVTQITICCHVDYYMKESCHDGFKVMYMICHFFCFSGLFLSFSHFVNFSVVLSMVEYVPLGVIYVPLNKK